MLGIVKTRIRDFRLQMGLSQERLAGLLKVSRQTVISLENGKYNASLVLAHKIAQLFEAQIEDIFMFEGDENL